MKCPYQTKVTHIVQYEGAPDITYEQNVVSFKDCIKDECPYYGKLTLKDDELFYEYCRKVEREIEK